MTHVRDDAYYASRLAHRARRRRLDHDDDIDWRDDDDGGGGGEEGGAIERATKTKNADRGGITSASSSSSYSPRGGDGIAPAWRASDCVALAEVKAHHGKDAEALVLLGRALDALRVEKGDAHDDTLACAKRVATALRKVADASSRAELEDVVVFAHDALVARHGAKDARTLSAAHDVGVVMRESGRTRDAIAWFKTCVEGRAEVLGDAHPLTLRCVLYTGSHTTASAWWTPILKDFCRRVSPPTPRFQSPPSTPFNSASDAFQLHPNIALYGPSTLRTASDTAEALEAAGMTELAATMARSAIAVAEEIYEGSARGEKALGEVTRAREVCARCGEGAVAR